MNTIKYILKLMAIAVGASATAAIVMAIMMATL